MADSSAPEETPGGAAAPRVSVVVPAYNAADYLERALGTVLAQTMPDLEILVVDDASADATFKVARQVAARAPRVRVLRNKRNGGAAASRNRALAKARGEWVALLDADDTWSAERLERMLASAGSADVISDDVYVVRKSRTKPTEPKSWSLLQEQDLAVTEPRRLGALDFVRHDLGLLKPIVRRSFLEQHGLAYSPILRYNEDFLLYFELLASGARWLQLPDAYYFYHKHAGAITVDKGALWRSAIETAQTLLRHPAVVTDELLTAALEGRVREARGHVAFAAVREALRQHRFVELARALLRDPHNLLLVAKFVIERIYLRARRGGFAVSGLADGVATEQANPIPVLG